MQIRNKEATYFTHQFVVGSTQNLIKPLLNVNITKYMGRIEKVIIPFGY